jgi:hypothetical protein
LRETPSAELTQRTEWNVRDADATVLFSMEEELTGGSLKTRELARLHGKPFLHLTPHVAERVERLRAFIAAHKVRVLNVAGPRASQAPGVAAFVRETLEAGFGRWASTGISLSRPARPRRESSR